MNETDASRRCIPITILVGRQTYRNELPETRCNVPTPAVDEVVVSYSTGLCSEESYRVRDGKKGPVPTLSVDGSTSFHFARRDRFLFISNPGISRVAGNAQCGSTVRSACNDSMITRPKSHGCPAVWGFPVLRGDNALGTSSTHSGPTATPVHRRSFPWTFNAARFTERI